MLFQWLEGAAEGWRERQVDIQPILEAAIKVKADIVQADERETGVRMHLNYGHTLGHALETVAEYRGIRHGEAVAWGMAFEARLAARLGVSSGAFVARQDSLLRRLGLLRELPQLDAGAVYERLFLDKKVRGGRIRWVLPRVEPGSVIVRDDVPEAPVRDLIGATVNGTLLDADIRGCLGPLIRGLSRCGAPVQALTRRQPHYFVVYGADFRRHATNVKEGLRAQARLRAHFLA